jgi:hypothetical protein
VNLASAETATVEIVASHPRFAIPMYTGTHVKIAIDGEESTFPWGATARVTYIAPSRGRTQTGTIESDRAVDPPDGLPEDLSDLSDAELVEAWNDFKGLAGRDPLKRLFLRKMRAEFERELERRGLSPESLGFER